MWISGGVHSLRQKFEDQKHLLSACHEFNPFKCCEFRKVEPSNGIPHGVTSRAYQSTVQTRTLKLPGYGGASRGEQARHLREGVAWTRGGFLVFSTEEVKTCFWKTKIGRFYQILVQNSMKPRLAIPRLMYFGEMVKIGRSLFKRLKSAFYEP